MGINDVMGRVWRENVLFSAFLELTYRCNLACRICYNDTAQQGRPLSREQYLTLFQDLRDLGTLSLTFSGGEPLAHPDFFALGAEARRHGFVVRIKTNGHALNERLARRVKDEIDPFGLDISLHGACAETHDRQTGVPGSFHRLLTNLGTLQDLGLRFSLNCPVTAWNEGEVEAIFALAERLGAYVSFDSDITPRDDGDRAPQALAPTPGGVERLERLQLTRERAAAKPGLAVPEPSPDAKQCGAGSAGVAIDPYGTVYPCVQWRRPVGNLHQSSIKAIWRDSQELGRIRQHTVTVKQLLDSYEDGHLMGFCAGRAQEETGTPLQVYPLALERMKLRQRLRKASATHPR